MATKSPLAAIALSPEEEPEVQRYKQAQDELRQALEARQNPLFDPVLLAMAQGFLTPTKSGSFGEALGTAAGLVGPAQAAEQKRVLEMAQLRSQLAAQELEQGRKGRALKMEQDFMRGLPSAEPSAQPGQPAAGTPSAPGSVVPPENRAPGQNQYGLYPPDLIDRIRRLDPERADVLDKSNKARMDQIKFLAGELKTTEGGSYSVDPSGKVTFTPRPGAKAEDIFVPGIGTMAMSSEDLIKFRTLQETLSTNPNDATALREFYRIIDKYRGAAPVRPAPAGAPTGEPSAPSRGPMTRGQEEALKKQQEVEAEAVGRGRGANTVAVMNAAKAGTSLLPIYDTMDATIKKPGMDKVLGVFERPNLLSSLGTLVEDAIRVGNFNIGMPAIRKAITQSLSANEISEEARKAGVTPQQLLDDLQFLGQSIAMTQFNQRQGLGSGTSVSNFEQMMVNAMGPTLQDTVGSFRKKLAFMKNKAEFEVELGRAMKDSGMQYDDFEGTAKFTDMFSKYQKKQLGIVYGGRPPANAPTGTWRVDR